MACVWPRLAGGGRGPQIGWVAEEMGVAGLAGAGLAREDGGERDGGLAAGFGDGFVGTAGGQALKRRLDGGEIVEGVEAVGAAAEFARGLGAAEHEEAEDGGLVAAEVEDGADAVLVLGDAAVADRGDEGEVFEGVQGLADLVFCEVKDGIAAGGWLHALTRALSERG
jgi:hypothetical protein